MNGHLRPSRPHLFTTAIGVLGAFFIMGILVWIMVRVTRPEPIGQGRAKERKTALVQIRNDEAPMLYQNSAQGAAPGFVRINISNAMDLILREYKQDAQKARAEMIARADKAATPPPAPPPPVNPYE